MKVSSREQMQAIDKKAIEEFGIPGLILMENAGRMSALKLMELFPLQKDLVVAIFVGSGNNGGDGLVIARHLYNQGIDVRVYIVGKEPDKGDALVNLKIARKLGIEIQQINSSSALKREAYDILEAYILIDALLGTGIRGQVKGIIAEVINFLNSLGQPIISIDIPSGLDCNTGRPPGTCVRAAYTFTLGLPKTGLLMYPGPEFVGELILLDISLPGELLIDEAIKTNLLLAEELQYYLPSYPPTVHKGQRGRVLVLAGSVGMTGAAALTSQAALAIGSGLVTLGIPESLNEIVEAKLTEVITAPLPETKTRSFSTNAYDQAMLLASKAEGIAIGPGISRNDETGHLIRELVAQITVPMVIDADGIFALARDKSILTKAKAPIVITPHPGEMANFLGVNIQEIQADRLATAQKVAQEYGITVVLKGAGTVIADKEGNTYFNSTGNSGLATAGTGDVLTGFIVGLIAQGLSPQAACCLGVFLHGLCGDLVTKDKGPLSLIASDLISKIPQAIREVRGEK